jgi:hypothetical protein
MDTRKMYVRPAVESEEILEQTSLACTGSEEGPGTYFGGGFCQIDVSKNGAYFDPEWGCTWITKVEPVILS